jgi:type II secretory pathway predicted ATPase ExeA
MNHQTLETIRIMSNFYFEEKNYISIIMAGTDDFIQQFRLRINQGLLQRISLFCSLNPLQRSKTTEYVDHQIKTAGVEREIITKQALNLVHDATSGTPRLINNLMKATLIETAEDGKEIADLEHVRKAMFNLMLVMENGK